HASTLDRGARRRLHAPGLRRDSAHLRLGAGLRRQLAQVLRLLVSAVQPPRSDRRGEPPVPGIDPRHHGSLIGVRRVSSSRRAGRRRAGRRAPLGARRRGGGVRGGHSGRRDGEDGERAMGDGGALAGGDDAARLRGNDGDSRRHAGRQSGGGAAGHGARGAFGARGRRAGDRRRGAGRNDSQVSGGVGRLHDGADVRPQSGGRRDGRVHPDDPSHDRRAAGAASDRRGDDGAEAARRGGTDRRARGVHRVRHGGAATGRRVVDDSAAPAAGAALAARGDGRGHLAELLRAGVSGASGGVPARRRDRAGRRPGIVWRRDAIARRAARSGPVSDAAVVESRSRSFVRDLIALTKPRIISLLLVTTIAPMFVAGRPAWTLVLAVFVGGYLMAGGANAVNMYIDRDIDDRMSRTRLRPIPSGRMQPREVLAFGVLLSTAAVWLFAAAANVLTAALALAGFYFYVFVYTRWLKRSTPQNIVIGGAAGAFPPLVGWAAVTGRIDLLAV